MLYRSICRTWIKSIKSNRQAFRFYQRKYHFWHNATIFPQNTVKCLV